MMTAIGVMLGVIEVAFIFGMFYYAVYMFCRTSCGLVVMFIKSHYSRLNQLLKSELDKIKTGTEVRK